jgi:hypothetical protein
MLQKSYWTLATAALAVGVLLVPAARPASAQVRMKLTAPRTAPLPTGGGIVLPNTTSGQAQTTVQPKPAPVVVTPPVTTVKPAVTTTTQFQSAPKGFPAGPSLLGAARKPLGRMVDRTGPDLNGDGYPDIAKDRRSK